MTFAEAIPLAALVVSTATFISAHVALRRKVEMDIVERLQQRVADLERQLEACEQRNLALLKRLLREELRHE